MAKGADSQGRRRWPAIVLVAAVVVLVGIAWWAGTAAVDTRIDAPVICVKCGHEGTVKVGDTPGDEEWPRACPKCHQDDVYLVAPCPACGKLIPLKDDHARRIGYPSECPHCHSLNTRGT